MRTFSTKILTSKLGVCIICGYICIFLYIVKSQKVGLVFGHINHSSLLFPLCVTHKNYFLSALGGEGVWCLIGTSKPGVTQMFLVSFQEKHFYCIMKNRKSASFLKTGTLFSKHKCTSKENSCCISTV